MARDVEMDGRLRAWAQYVTVGDGSGFPTMSVLHSEWQPPPPGVTPTMKVAAPSSARQTHRVIAGWSMRMRNTVALYYCTTLSIEDQAERLECAPRTVHQRVEEAHRLLRAAVGNVERSLTSNLYRVPKRAGLLARTRRDELT